ncbi:MAG: pyridoxal-phosphate dependent enzyme, partial [Gemmatimonadetes bacterium]|nr:pyridoxal-phosphate dependent enzyme [Gemmatimonadota bacterium]NIQ58310.1 pyridoxal-phosphate dependent enzyme [Gemmatimonadota bacterium]NIU78526.1 pyridoxal-phosphate dependent enzyme [Gammaproteobacteria bacterium]NIX25883.1 pyridoxal-phosphate dependent enzyme [Actinomycetota bacterium]NIX47397.1 pyridoxal-phosphate dependent enzyme [Gemmatimonadota bacterium]
EEGIAADVFVPENAPAQKKLRIREFGARLHTVDGIYDEAAAAARTFADEHDAYYLHAFVDPRVVAGQGTVGLEIAGALPGVREVLVPVGGGGLIAGTGRALRETLDPPPRILGV